MEEKFLYHIWDAGHLNLNLHTVSGKQVKIGYQGQFNTFRGPDFVNAIINIDGEDFRGGVEIHINTQDWIKHAHQEDEFYNQVILHVVFNHNSAGTCTIKENGELSEILELKEQLSEDIFKLIETAYDTPISKSDTYCELLSAIDNDHLLALLALHGKQRFLGKVRRFNASLNVSDFDQILYEGIMEAAGYDKNKLNMLQLAQSIPFHYLREWHRSGMDVTGMISIISGSSGLLLKSKTRLPEDLYATLMHAYEAQPFQAKKVQCDWQLFRIRPLNHPMLRIILVAEFIFSCFPEGLLNRTLMGVEFHSPDPSLRYKRFTMLFAPQTDTLMPSKNGLGRSVINNTFLNIYLPIMYLYAQKTADEGMQNSVMESWNTFAALQENHIIRFMCRHISPSQVKLVGKRALYQQGMMDIFYRSCRYHLCSQCKNQSSLYA